MISRRCLLGSLALPGLAYAQKPGVSNATQSIVDRLADTKWVNRPSAALPKGVVHRTYASKALGKEVGYCLYLPPSYQSEAGKRYPVIYNLHGAGGNELHGFEEARLLDKGIREGRWPEMILVMPNGGKATFYKDSHDGKWPAETMLIRELLPMVDAQLRTVPARSGRAIEGFSMGGRGATRLAMKYPELFCSLFNQAGNVMHTYDAYDAGRPGEYPMFYLGLDRARFADNDTYKLLEKNLAKIKGRMRIQVWCGTRDDGHLGTVREYHQALLRHGVDHTYMEIEGLEHKRTEMIARYESIWFDYHVESFRRASA